MGLKKDIREYVMGPPPLEAWSLNDFISLGKANGVFYIDARASFLRERHIGRRNVNGLVTPRIKYTGHAKDAEISYVQSLEDARLTEADLATPEQKTRVRLALLLTGDQALQQAREQIQHLSTGLYDDKRKPLIGEDITRLREEATRLGVKSFPVR